MESDKIKVIEVTTSKEMDEFVRFPFSLYKDNPFWTPPLIQEEIDTLNKDKNPVFKNALGNYFLAIKRGKIVGRVAVMINWIEVKELKKNKVRFGWFDVVDDINVTAALMQKVYSIGKNNGMEFIEGPVGFSNLDKAGMLIKGFEEMNTMITWYNYPYYYEHFKKLGFKNLAVWVEYEIKLSSFEKSPEKIKKILEFDA